MNKKLFLTLAALGSLCSLQAKTPSHYTGVIVDARHLNINRSPTPKIMDATTGREVFGTIKIKEKPGDKGWDLDTLMNKGVVGYETNMKVAMASKRVGENTIVVRAVKTDEFSEMVFVSGDDAKKITEANKANGILEKLAVIFVK